MGNHFQRIYGGVKVTLTIAVLSAVCMPAAAQMRAIPFAMCSDRNSFYIAIKNIGKDAASINASDLPWDPTSKSIRYMAYSIGADGKVEQLKSSGMILDRFSNPKITFNPGEIKYELVPLSFLIRNFDEVTKDKDIILSYSIKEGQEVLPGKGIIFIPKKHLFSKSCISVVPENIPAG